MALVTEEGWPGLSLVHAKCQVSCDSLRNNICHDETTASTTNIDRTPHSQTRRTQGGLSKAAGYRRTYPPLRSSAFAQVVDLHLIHTQVFRLFCAESLSCCPVFSQQLQQIVGSRVRLTSAALFTLASFERWDGERPEFPVGVTIAVGARPCLWIHVKSYS